MIPFQSVSFFLSFLQVQQKQSTGGEGERRGSETPVRETDSQYGTWETGLRSDDRLAHGYPTAVQRCDVLTRVQCMFSVCSVCVQCVFSVCSCMHSSVHRLSVFLCSSAGRCCSCLCVFKLSLTHKHELI